MKIIGCESLELLFSKYKNKYYQMCFEKSPIYGFIMANIPKRNLVTLNFDNSKISLKSLYFDENKILKETDLTKQMKRGKIDGLLPWTHSSIYKEKWAKENEFHLIVSPWKTQKKLENKIFFDNMLTKNELPKPQSWIIKSAKDINLVKKFPAVLQSPNSNGSFGTFFLKNKLGIEKIINMKNLKFPLLCREFINGQPFGVTLLISKEKMIFSAIRLQMFFLNKDGTNRYYGTQWIKKSEFSKEVMSEIESSLVKIGKLLQSQGFHGIANFDFMVRNNKIFFIECNPRLAGPTPQVSHTKELLHNLDFAEEFINAITGQPLSANKSFIPDTKYKGCTIDLDFLKTEWMNLSTKNAQKAGLYKVKNNNLEYISENARDYNKEDSILICHNLLPNTRITKNSSLGFAFMHKPAAKIHKNSYSFTDDGKKILNTLKWILVKKS